MNITPQISVCWYRDRCIQLQWGTEIHFLSSIFNRYHWAGLLREKSRRFQYFISVFTGYCKHLIIMSYIFSSHLKIFFSFLSVLCTKEAFHCPRGGSCQPTLTRDSAMPRFKGHAEPHTNEFCKVCSSRHWQFWIQKRLQNKQYKSILQSLIRLLFRKWH